MSLCVLDEFVLSKSRHLVEGDAVTAQLSVLTCENKEGAEECVYWVQLFDSQGDPVMKDVSVDFLKAHETFNKLKDTIGMNIP